MEFLSNLTAMEVLGVAVVAIGIIALFAGMGKGAKGSPSGNGGNKKSSSTTTTSANTTTNNDTPAQ